MNPPPVLKSSLPHVSGPEGHEIPAFASDRATSAIPSMTMWRALTLMCPEVLVDAFACSLMMILPLGKGMV